MSAVTRLPRERRHTVLFLREIRGFAPVFLDTEVDMSAVVADRAEHRSAGRHRSVVSYVLWAAARALVAHPQANAAIGGRGAPRVLRFGSAAGKLALDKTLNGQRVALSAVLPDLDTTDLTGIQRLVDRYRDGGAEDLPEFAGARTLDRLPWPVSSALYRMGVRPLGRRALAMGTFAVTSLGHSDVDGFHSVGGTAVTIGVGRILERPVVRAGEIVAAPVMRLNLAFDHRVLDGAEAAELLGDIKHRLEAPGLCVWQEPDPDPETEAEPVRHNDVEELKQYALVHAQAQGLADDFREVVSQVRDDGDGPDSWVARWSAQADKRLAAGKPAEAARLFTMARFPYVDGPARLEAQGRALDAFGLWRRRVPGIERLEAEVDGRRFACWSSGLSADRPLPVLLIMGGIVTPKEEWAPVLAGLRRFGMAGIVAELPGVGEHRQRYDADSWRMISAVLDAAAGRAQVDQTYALALSFSGHLALRCAVNDPRIRGIVTVGAPVSAFFTETSRPLPAITRDTLCRLTGLAEEELREGMRDWALTEQELAKLDIPVHYLASDRDEIIPAAETEILERCVADLSLRRNDDVHGSPAHTAQTRLWSMLSVLRMRGVRNPSTAILATMLRLRDRADAGPVDA